VPQSVGSDYKEFQITSAALRAKITTTFPIEMDIQNYFLDSAFNVIDSLFNTRRDIKPAEVNAFGLVEVPRLVEFELEITNQKLRNIYQAAYSVPVFRLRTPNEKQVKILSSHKVNLKLTGDIIFDVDLNE
jgi:hypothetical protein